MIQSWSALFSYVLYRLLVVCCSLVFIFSVGSGVLLLVAMCGLSQVLTVDCQLSLSVVVVSSRLSALHCRSLVVDCLYWLPLSFSIVSAQLCLIFNSTS